MKPSLFYTLLVLLVFSCSKNTYKTKYSCNMNNSIIRVVSNEKGQIVYLKNQEVYAIRIASSIDNESFYILCDLPLNAKNINDNVSFSGNVRSSSIMPQVGGQNYYELEVSDITYGDEIK